MGPQYIDICYNSNQFWGARIANRARHSSCHAISQRMAAWEQSELCLAVSTKQAMLEHILRRIDNQLSRLRAELGDQAKLDNCIRPDSCFQLSNCHLAFEILVDVDSFLFELRSAYEIMGKFLRGFFREVLGEDLKEQMLLKALEQANLDTQWIDRLSESRKYFFHDTAPWIAVYIMSTSPLDFELVICKKDAKDFSNPDDFIHLEELRKIYSGFKNSLPILEGWVAEQIAAHEGGTRNARDTLDQ